MKTRTKILTSVGIMLGLGAAALSVSLPIVLQNQNVTSETVTSGIKSNNLISSQSPIIESTSTRQQEVVTPSVSSDTLVRQDATIKLEKIVSNGVDGDADIVDPNLPEFVDQVDNEFTKYQLTIELKDEIARFATLSFVDKDGTDLGTSIFISPGQTIYVQMRMEGSDYTLTDLKIFDIADPNISLGVEQIAGKDNFYSFTMPEAGSKFYQKNEIGIQAEFGKAQINSWTYDFSSRTYAITIEKGYIGAFLFDDTTIEGQKLQAVPNKFTQYRVYMNDNDVVIRHLTIPQGCQLMFINNKEDSKTNDKAPTVYLEKTDSITISGAVGQYGSVNYSNKMAAACGLPEIPVGEDVLPALHDQVKK
ncbi:hypothetical protein [Mycoplasmoides alvi]|uniref:hypothetical protein n=1 Tax=Mycoplasmoides alvi TaxID=78580 RepID=UPI00051C2142|nr:hypothetical protein [Mycoplasmoides alvi]